MGTDSQKIEWGLTQLLKESRKKEIFDLTEVCYVDSSGVGILMMGHAKLLLNIVHTFPVPTPVVSRSHTPRRP